MLLKRAQDAGVVHPLLDSRGTIGLVSSLPDGFRNERGCSGLIDIVLRGMKTFSAAD